MSVKKGSIKFSEERLRDLLVGAFDELRESTNNFPSACETIGITEEELDALGFSTNDVPVEKDIEDYTYFCNCCGTEFEASECMHIPASEEDIECPTCGCTLDTGYIVRNSK